MITITGISNLIHFKGNDGNDVACYRIDVTDTYDHPDAVGGPSDKGYIRLPEMRSEYYDWYDKKLPVIVLRSRNGKINGFILDERR